MRLFVLTLLVILSEGVLSSPDVCTYNTYQWNTYTKQAERFTQVKKPYSDITEEESDEITGCTICQEDQVELFIGNSRPFLICKHVAMDIQYALEKAISLGQPVVEVIGYRVGRTKGKIDQNGNRTQFSNHSFGTAIDINPEFNGLYDNCISYNSSCRLIKGGRWGPDQEESLRADSFIVEVMRSVGFIWGGKILGKQKDFMHFSLSGY